MTISCLISIISSTLSFRILNWLKNKTCVIRQVGTHQRLIVPDP